MTLNYGLSRFAALAFAIVMVATKPVVAAGGNDPVAPIESLYRTLIATMQQAKELGVKGRYDKLAPTLAKTYDIASMAKISVGPSWDTLQPQQQSGIVEAFTRMMVANYASRFDGYSGEKFEITDATDQASDKLVKTQIVQSNGKTTSLNYVMRNGQGGWRVVDVYLDGTISELASRRAEFSAILKSGGPDALISSLRQQGEKLLGGA